MADEYRVIAHGIADDGQPSWTLSASAPTRDTRPLWRRALNLCRPGRRHDWQPIGFADWQCWHCAAIR